MKKFAYLMLICALMVVNGRGADAPGDEATTKLTVELRDGSRVVGTGSHEALKFHSTSMGDLNLTWADIRSIDCGTDQDAARLLAANGDVYEVHFASASVMMETSFGKSDLPVKEIRSVKVMTTGKPGGARTPGASDDKSLRLTVDTRDGSTVIGKTLDDMLSVHSATLGDIKLPWSGIRSVEYAADTKTARLIGTNGDVFTVEFSTPALHMETILGKIELPAKLIRSVRVSKGGVDGEHLIGWWKLDEGSGTVAKDSSENDTTHDGTISTASMWTHALDQEVGLLRFDGSNESVSLGNILQASYPGISLSCWVQGAGNGFQILAERSILNNPDGIALSLNADNAMVYFGHYQDGIGTNVSVADGSWHYIVGTMAQSGKGYVYSIYVDGRLGNTETIGTGLTATSQGWLVGISHMGGYSFRGVMRDFRIYDCALSPEDIKAVYENQSDSMPLVPVTVFPISPAHSTVDIENLKKAERTSPR